MRMACPAERAAQNVESKRVVIYMNLRESGYFGHAMDNVLPRVAAIMDGVLKGAGSVARWQATGLIGASGQCILQQRRSPGASSNGFGMLFEVPNLRQVVGGCNMTPNGFQVLSKTFPCVK